MEGCISVCSSIDAGAIEAIELVVVAMTARDEPKTLSALAISPALTDKLF